ncbi:MAG: GNAT family N-acetyltransferase [Burkholderia sp.]
MEPITIRPCACDDVFNAPNFADLAAEYQSEAARNADLFGRPPDLEGYKRLEANGVLHALGVFYGEMVVGFAGLLVTPVLHFQGRLIGTVESLFVASGYRAGGTGTALLRAVEDRARDLGAVGLYITSPADGRVAAILPRSGYRETNRTFYRGLA